jgi:hypothetical protein
MKWVASLLLLMDPSSSPTTDTHSQVTKNQNGFTAAVSEVTQAGVAPTAVGPASNEQSGSDGGPSCLEAKTPGCEVIVSCGGTADSGPEGYQTLVITATSETMLGPCQPGQSDQAAEPARITPGRVLQAFRRIPLPAAELDVQPPGGKTLANLDTIFSTTTGDLDRTITLLGREVHLRITPTAYTWHHGDGSSQTSDWPGRAWEEGVADMGAYLTHAYSDAHVTVRPSVDVTYAAEYRVGNGPWRPVDGTVTIEGPPSALRILEARPVLTGDGR